MTGTSRAEDSGPDFMCVGAQKAGTRWLHDQLQRHPDFWMPAIKELSYFNRLGSRKAKARRLLARARGNLDRLNGIREGQRRSRLTERDLDFLGAIVELDRTIDLAAYARLFRDKGESIAGDITPGYSTLGEAVVAEIAGRFPLMKVVFIARDPVERLWSQIGMDVAKGRIGKVVDEASLRVAIKRPQVDRRSGQSAIVERWRRHTGDRFRLFFFDDLVADPVGLRAKIIGFLGGDPEKSSGTPANFNRKAGKTGGPLAPGFRDLLAAHFADEIRLSAEVLGGPAAGWAGKYGL